MCLCRKIAPEGVRERQPEQSAFGVYYSSLVLKRFRVAAVAAADEDEEGLPTGMMTL